MLMAAAPRYLEPLGAPMSLADLSRHDCIGYRLLNSGGLYAWELIDANGKDVAIPTRGSVVVSDAIYARELALAGIGVAYLAEPLIRADLDAGRLVAVLTETAISEPGFFVYFPRRSAQVGKPRAFLDAARHHSAATATIGGRE